MVHIDYAAQFSGAPAAAGGRAAGGGSRKQGRARRGRAGHNGADADATPASGYGAAAQRGGAAAQGTPGAGHWITERHGNSQIRVCLMLQSQRFKAHSVHAQSDF